MQQTTRFNKGIAYLIMGILCTTSCKEQPKIAQPNISVESNEFGKVVESIDPNIWAIHQDMNEHFWFGSNGTGVYRYDGKEIIQFTTEDGLIHNQIRGIQSDNNGSVYIETPSGISKYEESKFTSLIPISNPLNEWKLQTDDLWFKCNGNANDVFRYDGTSLFELKLPKQDLNKAFQTEVNGLSFEESDFSPYSVFGINKDTKGNMWFGTGTAGAYRFDGTSFMWFAEPELTALPDGRVPGVRCMVEDKDGYFWLSNMRNKYEIIESAMDPDNIRSGYKKLDGIKNLEDVSLPYFMSAIRDNQTRDLWMLTYGEGIWRYDGEKVINYMVRDGEKELYLMTIYKDHDGHIYLGTQDDGVYKYNGVSFSKFL